MMRHPAGYGRRNFHQIAIVYGQLHSPADSDNSWLPELGPHTRHIDPLID